jgi:hypothetical protein
MDVSCCKDFYDMDAAKYNLGNTSEEVTYIFPAKKVEPYVRQFGLAVAAAFDASAAFSSKRRWC